jgi:integrase
MRRQGLSAKAVQSRLGHSTVNMTLNVYSHLFPQVFEQEGATLAFGMNATDLQHFRVSR